MFNYQCTMNNNQNKKLTAERQDYAMDARKRIKYKLLKYTKYWLLYRVDLLSKIAELESFPT